MKHSKKNNGKRGEEAKRLRLGLAIQARQVRSYQKHTARLALEQEWAVEHLAWLRGYQAAIKQIGKMLR